MGNIFGKHGPPYNFFRPELRDLSYAIGDVYSPESVAWAQAHWDLPTKDGQYPYLKHIKDLSPRWPHLRLLADFMEVSTTPVRWWSLNTKEKKKNEEREERARRTNVTRLDYLDSGKVVPNNYTTPETLRDALQEDSDQGDGNQEDGEQEDADKVQLRLFVVEDLSRDVIETPIWLSLAFFYLSVHSISGACICEIEHGCKEALKPSMHSIRVVSLARRPYGS